MNDTEIKKTNINWQERFMLLRSHFSPNLEYQIMGGGVGINEGFENVLEINNWGLE